jgi:hypothetical protein
MMIIIKIQIIVSTKNRNYDGYYKITQLLVNYKYLILYFT